VMGQISRCAVRTARWYDSVSSVASVSARLAEALATRRVSAITLALRILLLLVCLALAYVVELPVQNLGWVVALAAVAGIATLGERDERLGLATQAVEALVTYLIIYTAMNLGAFAVVIAVARRTGSGDISSFAGLGQYAPALAVAMSGFLFALAGIPPFGGWYAKFQVFRAVVSVGTPGATVVSVGTLPAIRTAGSPPGRTLKMKKTKTETANITKTIAISRLTTKRAIYLTAPLTTPALPWRGGRARRGRRRRRCSATAPSSPASRPGRPPGRGRC